MKMDVLSPFSFYGGKAKMAPLICSMLDYDNTDIYIEPFGGACRVLLNKPKHEVELYNDFGVGLYEFFHAMSDPMLSKKVISALYELTPSRELFLEMKEYKSTHENDIVDEMKNQFKELSYRLAQKYNSAEFKELHKKIIEQDYREVLEIAKEIVEKGVIRDVEDAKAFQKQIVPYEDYWEIVEEDYDEAYRKTGDHEKALQAIQHYTSDILISNGAEADMKSADMAVATFVTYYLSRDGMGKAYSVAKGNSIDAYYRQIGKLGDVAERFEGVGVTQLDALMLVKKYRMSENVMLYLDPSYLNADDENIDEDFDEDAMNQKYDMADREEDFGEYDEDDGEKNKKDLGKGIYNRSFDYKKHLSLVRMIRKAKAHIIVSNYDVAPYNILLTEKNGWKRMEFETTTGVGNKKDNLRTEVLWYNY